MKILHIFDHSLPLHSGYTFRSRAILQQQRVLGYHTCHVTSPKHPNSENDSQTAEGFSFYRTKAYQSWFWRLPVLKELAVVLALKKRLLQLIKLEQPDILHAHSPALNGLAALWAAKKAGIPLVYEIRAFWEDAAVDHGSCEEGDVRYRLTRALETYVAKKANAITTICEGLRRDLISRGISADKITVVANAVDPEQFQLISERNSPLELQYQLKNKLVLGFLGSFYAYEGLDLLIKALPLIRQKVPSATLLLVGGGPQEAALKQLVSQLGLKDAVIMPGRVPHSDVMQYYSLVDLLVYPRKAMRLTELVTPLKPLEAMAQGMRLLASDVGGHLELIEHGKTGWLFQRDNIDDLAEQAVRILKNFSNHDKIIANGLQFIRTERNWAASVGHYVALYQRLQHEH
ncbi:TIGR04063 family PEP-CTERM/XrtA system glycosyltransferase [Rheinheimera maricola]|uniref:Glycosyltransferase, exosortase A system-associated n=1 Tax=Rheinheimera maricola TaxID=2793282 RepID=A0ABS7X851_9GAMM|nr:TIGR04063 family PEP-CTERM/XrtA system glycosyltransferase [Rheinheimera maricola]MBZ9611725.1 glycosyltransferase, exosortase A system-associated [Rheinheimera maricola]